MPLFENWIYKKVQLQGIILSKINWSQKDKYCVILFTGASNIIKIIEMINSKMVTRD